MDTAVHFGPILSDLVQWIATAFGAALAGAAVAAIYKLFQYLGIQITLAQRDQLQAIIINGLNDAAMKTETALKKDPKLVVDVKSKVIADAISYTQVHAADTIKALGLDPVSGEAVEAIRARIATAITDPATPTPPALAGK